VCCLRLEQVFGAAWEALFCYIFARVAPERDMARP
jgi:hypothetical protein